MTYKKAVIRAHKCAHLKSSGRLKNYPASYMPQKRRRVKTAYLGSFFGHYDGKPTSSEIIIKTSQGKSIELHTFDGESRRFVGVKYSFRELQGLIIKKNAMRQNVPIRGF